jgi:ribosomal protein S24E
LNAGSDLNLLLSWPFREAVDEVAELLMSDLKTSREPVVKEIVRLTGIEAQDTRLVRGLATVYIFATSRCPASRGYEPLLIKRGENPLLARVKAFVAVDQGRKIADESRRCREVVTAIRFLAKPNRSRWAVNRKIALLLAASRETRVIRAIFTEAGLSDHILINLLPYAAEGGEMATERILEIARMAAPRIRIRRGPKVFAASATHELFLEKNGIRGASAYSYSESEGDFVDEATKATRLEFPGTRFGPQPASRRLKARRQLAGAPISRRGSKGV